MARTDYSARMPWGETLTISADLEQASANIAIAGPPEGDDDEPSWSPTPYQTADARHRATDAMILAVRYSGTEWYTDPSKGDADDQLAEIEAAIRSGKIVISAVCDAPEDHSRPFPARVR
jgi:hypothetical protein